MIVVTTDFQMTTTCQYSHAVLPAVSWYEKTDLVATPVHPYLQLQQPAVKPLYEGKRRKSSSSCSKPEDLQSTVLRWNN